ncbi:ecto-ADP-ribosyltransferase 4-like [Scomber japonicus]|uniref:ecto-ADP-ribosyltransferase 4-like n=1 Tax=Scomber japonicus TaxID=13676 RepID=UPI0023060C0F|nr:ecto-ADP-ribosyltransferase 4-like [Scomber japonicus]
MRSGLDTEILDAVWGGRMKDLLLRPGSDEPPKTSNHLRQTPKTGRGSSISVELNVKGVGQLVIVKERDTIPVREEMEPQAQLAVLLTAEMDRSCLIFVTVCLVAVGFLQLVASQSVPLDMVPESIDDMYRGCKKEMANKVNKKYFKKEYNGIFKQAWINAEKCSHQKPDAVDKALNKNHMHAICAYSSKIIYKEFNLAVRTSKNTYSSSFKFHSLHYWLTSAIQILKDHQPCHTTFRRTKSVFTGKVNSFIRFGTFASSSFDNTIVKYGRETCFQITTCLGAFLKHYEVFNNKEVLIPPYEVFKIKKIYNGQGTFPPLPDCKRVFILESAGKQSNLNCKVAK